VLLIYLCVCVSNTLNSGHQLGNSIAVLRQYYALGVRYVTLTHTCHNAFADSCGMLPGMIPLHGGLRCVASCPKYETQLSLWLLVLLVVPSSKKWTVLASLLIFLTRLMQPQLRHWAIQNPPSSGLIHPLERFMTIHAMSLTVFYEWLGLTKVNEMLSSWYLAFGFLWLFMLWYWYRWISLRISLLHQGKQT